MYAVGAPITLSVSFADAAGTAVDPTTVTLTVIAPDGTASPGIAAVRDSTGSYHVDYVPSVAGRFQWFFVGTGANATVQAPDVFNVDAATTSALVSLEQGRQQLNKTSTKDDEEIRRFIRSASKIVNSYCGYTAPTVITETVPYSRGVLVLNHLPVMSVTSVALAGASGVIPDLSLLQDGGLESGVLRFNYSTVPPSHAFVSRVTVTYMAGRGFVPDELQEACLILLQWLWDTQRGPATPKFRGGNTDTEDEGEDRGMPTRAIELMEASDYAALPSIG
jgi:hypothetical protein